MALYLEPINGTAVDEGRELPQTIPEGISDGREGDDDVEVLPTTIDKEGKERQGTEVCILITSLSCWSHSLIKS